MNIHDSVATSVSWPSVQQKSSVHKKSGITASATLNLMILENPTTNATIGLGLLCQHNFEHN